MAEKLQAIPLEYQPRSELASHFDVLTPYQLLDDVRREAITAQQRMFVQVMDVDAGHIPKGILALMEQATKRGVDTRLHVDYFTLMVTEGKFNYLAQLIPGEREWNQERKNAKVAMLRHAREQGVNVTVTNYPKNLKEKLLPVLGRNHMKAIVIDNVAYLMGENLADKDYTRVDYGVKITDPAIVEPIIQQFHRVNEQHPQEDYAVQCTKDTQLLVDSGRVGGESLIYNHGLALIQDAQQRIVYAGQFDPDGRMRASLHEAWRRGVDVLAITSDPRAIEDIALWAGNRVDLVRNALSRNHVPTLRYPGWVHAKALLVDDQVICGSHNQSEKGVKAGTAEIALQSSNYTLVTNFESYFEMLQRTVEMYPQKTQ